MPSSQKTKILHVIKTLGLGGAEVNLFNLVNAIDQSRFEVHVAYSAGGEIEERFRRSGIRLIKFADDSHKLLSWASWKIIFRLAKYILKHRIPIVHTHTFNAQVWGGCAARLTGAKVVEHVHDFRYCEAGDFARRRGVSQQYQYVKFFRYLADRVVVLTKQNVDFILKNQIQPAHHVKEFQNGIPILAQDKRDDHQRQEILKQYHLPEDALIILTPIRLAPEKNADLILRIAPEVLKTVKHAYFLIAGDGPLFGQILADIKVFNLTEHVRLIGFHPDIRQLLQATDVMLLPSFLELHSIAILEAMSMQVPVVVSRDVGCQNEFISDGVNGLLRDPFSEAGWAEALIGLLKDGRYRQQIGQAGFKTCQDLFNIEQTIKRFEQLYEELVKD